MDIKNNKEVIVALDCSRTANVQVWDPNIATTYLGNGEVVVTDEVGNILDNTVTVATKSIRIKSRDIVGDGTQSSVELRGQDITGFYCENYAVASEQKVVLGYDGSAGNADINLAADSLYWFKMIPLFKRGERNPETFSWRSGAVTPTVADVVTGITANLNIKAGMDKLLKVVAYVETSSATTAVTPTARVIKGSKAVTFATAHGLTAGTFIIIDSKVYVVDEIRSTTQLVLNQPYLGASNLTIAVASIDDESTGNWGLTIEGLPYKFEVGLYNYNKAKFSINFPVSLFNSKATVTAADSGIGTYEQVREEEWSHKGRKGEGIRVGLSYPTKFVLNTDSVATSETYDLITITYNNDSTKNLDGNVNHEGAVLIAVPVGAGQADGGTTTLEEVLNKYIVTEYKVGTAIAVS